MKRMIFILIAVAMLITACETTDSGNEQAGDVTNGNISSAVKYYDFGKEYLKNKQYDSAIKNFMKAIEDSSTYRDAYLGLGNAYENKMYYDRAESIYNVLSEKLPEDPAGVIAKGYLNLTLRDYTNAEKLFNEGLALDNTNANAYFGLGKVYEKKYGGEEGILKAISCYEKACQFNPEDLTIAYKYGKALLELKQYKKAVKFLEQVVADHPNIVGPISNLAEAYLESGDYNNAIDAFNRTLELDETIVNAYLGLARSYNGLKDYKSAEKAYLKLAEVKTNSTVPYLYLGQMYLNIKYYDSAIKYLNKAISINPNDARALLLLGQAYFYKGDPKNVKTESDREFAYSMLDKSESYFQKIIDMGGSYKSDAEKGIKNIKQWRKELDPTRW